MKYKFNYKWCLKDGYPSKGIKKHNKTVFSCFACGGGSTMGYKLAGYNVLGCNEIDPKMIEAYKLNHNPKYAFLEGIQTFKNRHDLPDELYNLDILDGSPPCSSFSMSGNRSKDWGKEKKFREGQAKQVLDTLFFDFIDLAEKLKPKIVVAENVKGLIQGDANKYVNEIRKAFNKAGYYFQLFLLNAADMGVPQKRERVFIICMRKDLAGPFLYKANLFEMLPKIKLNFNEKKIPFKQIQQTNGVGCMKFYPGAKKLWELTKNGDSFDVAYKKIYNKNAYFSYRKVCPFKVLKTITAHCNGGGQYHHIEPRSLSKKELCFGGSYPLDYNFLELNPKYLIGMSVPPLMTAQISTKIYEQWLKYM
jgi:DNA (cytosine-5)-methyltransferase 1